MITKRSAIFNILVQNPKINLNKSLLIIKERKKTMEQKTYVKIMEKEL